MTTTAFDDQFAPEPVAPVRERYDTAAILRRNIADAEKEMQRQAERAESYAETLRSLASYVGAGGYNADAVDAGVFEEKVRWGIGVIMARMEKAETELAKLAQQKPVAHIDYWKSDGTLIARRQETSGGKLYAAPVPAPHKGATHCDDCGLTWLDDGLNPLRCPYCKDAIPAPAVPTDHFRDATELVEWRDVMKELADDAEQSLLIQYSDKERYPSLMLKFNNDMALVKQARALLQSAEVQTSDKWKLTPCQTHPVDRNTGEVRHD